MMKVSLAKPDNKYKTSIYFDLAAQRKYGIKLGDRFIVYGDIPVDGTLRVSLRPCTSHLTGSYAVSTSGREGGLVVRVGDMQGWRDIDPFGATPFDVRLNADGVYMLTQLDEELKDMRGAYRKKELLVDNPPPVVLPQPDMTLPQAIKTVNHYLAMLEYEGSIKDGRLVIVRTSVIEEA